MMKIVRLAISLMLEVGVFYFTGGILWCIVQYAQHSHPENMLIPENLNNSMLAVFVGGHPFIAIGGSLALAALCLVMAIAIGSPYRYNIETPGMKFIKCGRCDLPMGDAYRCAYCHSIRPTKFVSTFLYGVSALVTSIALTHDVIFLCAAKRKA